MLKFQRSKSIRPTTLSVKGVAEGFNAVCKGTYFFGHNSWHTASTVDKFYHSANTEVRLIGMQYLIHMLEDACKTLKHNVTNYDNMDYFDFVRNHCKPQYVEEVLNIAGYENPANPAICTPFIIKRSEVDALACKLIVRHQSKMNYIYNSQEDLTLPLLLDILNVISSDKVGPCTEVDAFLSGVHEVINDNRFYLYSIFGFPKGYPDFQ